MQFGRPTIVIIFVMLCVTAQAETVDVKYHWRSLIPTDLDWR